MSQLWLDKPPVWFRVNKFDPRAASLADRHYSRQTIGAKQTLGPGQTLLMLTPDERAVWGVVCNLDPVGELRWRNSIFHNESSTRSSDLIRAATQMTHDRWKHFYGGFPPVPLTTEVDILATIERRSKRSPPGQCYYMAGWTFVRDIPAGHGRSAKVELEAPR